MASTLHIRLKGILLISLLTGTGCAMADTPEANESADEHVTRLFGSMRDGTYRARAGLGFPELGWEHIPALLELGESRRVLTRFPINPISSQAETECTEGMIALWLVEGIRRGGRLTMAPLCLKHDDKDDWTVASERNHPDVLAAYRRWWGRVKGLPKEKAAEANPLEGTGMAWH